MIKVRSVKSQMLEDGYGYLRITQFQVNTGEEVGKALTKLRQENGQEAARPGPRPAQQPGRRAAGRRGSGRPLPQEAG